MWGKQFWERHAWADYLLGRAATRAERQCAGKRRLTEEAAVVEAQRLRYRDAQVRAFRCDYCGEWHVGRARTISA